MTDLFFDNYSGEMFFDIDDIEQGDGKCSFTFKAEYDGKTVGARFEIPLTVKRSLFKTIKYVPPRGQAKITSIGEESDNLICAFEALLKPSYKSSRRFSETPDAVDYAILNREVYEFDSDKIYLKLYNGEDQSDFDEDEKINLEMQFTFNLATKRASLSETRDGYSADIIAVLMK